VTCTPRPRPSLIICWYPLRCWEARSTTGCGAPISRSSPSCSRPCYIWAAPLDEDKAYFAGMLVLLSPYTIVSPAPGGRIGGGVHLMLAWC
jgi:hypothetical protein